jgi:integrase
VKWGHLSENPARGVELPALRCVRPKWALTPAQAAALIDGLSAMAQAMVGLAILSGLRRGELFALRWRDIDQDGQRLTVRESVYDGQFGTPKTEAGVRQIPLSAPAFSLISEWKHDQRVHAGARRLRSRRGRRRGGRQMKEIERSAENSAGMTTPTPRSA